MACKLDIVDKELLFLAHLLNTSKIDKEEAEGVIKGIRESIANDLTSSKIAVHAMRIVSNNANVLWLADKIEKEVRNVKC